MEGMNQSLHTAIQGENEVNIFVSKWERNGESREKIHNFIIFKA